MGIPHSKPRKMTVPYGDRPQWQQARIDQTLNAIYPINDRDEWVHAAYKLSQGEERGTRTAKTILSGAKPVIDLHYKLSSRYYRNDYQPGPTRVSRIGLPWSYTELLTMSIAFDQRNDAQHRERPATVEYIARLLQREVREVVTHWHALYGAGLLGRQPPHEAVSTRKHA